MDKAIYLFKISIYLRDVLYWLYLFLYAGLVASYKRLCGGITFVERIPRTSNGKILRLKVQQLATALQPLT